MDKYQSLRTNMIASQLKARGITNKKVLSVMQKIPRHVFVGENVKDSAYDDHPLPIGENQTISQPYMVALMTDLLKLSGRERVLEIGTGSGYQTAVLASLCKHVFTIDRFSSLIHNAKEHLDEIGLMNVSFLAGDGTLGWPEQAPFDCILVTAGSPNIPEPLVSQLDNNGIMVIPVGSLFSQNLKVITKKDDKIKIENTIDCVFVKLIGEHGWQEK